MQLIQDTSVIWVTNSPIDQGYIWLIEIQSLKYVLASTVSVYKVVSHSCDIQGVSELTMNVHDNNGVESLWCHCRSQVVFDAPQCWKRSLRYFLEWRKTASATLSIVEIAMQRTLPIPAHQRKWGDYPPDRKVVGTYPHVPPAPTPMPVRVSPDVLNQFDMGPLCCFVLSDLTHLPSR